GWSALAPVSDSFPTRRSSDLAGVSTKETSQPAVNEPWYSPTYSAATTGVVQDFTFVSLCQLPKLTASSPSLRVSLKPALVLQLRDRKSTRLNSSHVKISYAVF